LSTKSAAIVAHAVASASYESQDPMLLFRRHEDPMATSEPRILVHSSQVLVVGAFIFQNRVPTIAADSVLAAIRHAVEACMKRCSDISSYSSALPVLNTTLGDKPDPASPLSV